MHKKRAPTWEGLLLGSERLSLYVRRRLSALTEMPVWCLPMIISEVVFMTEYPFPIENNHADCLLCDQ